MIENSNSKFECHTKLYDKIKGKYYGPAWHDLKQRGIHDGVTAFMKLPMPFSEE